MKQQVVLAMLAKEPSREIRCEQGSVKRSARSGTR